MDLTDMRYIIGSALPVGSIEILTVWTLLCLNGKQIWRLTLGVSIIMTYVISFNWMAYCAVDEPGIPLLKVILLSEQ